MVLSPLDDDDFQAMLRCAWWYYIEGKTQAEIAKTLSTSRASVGRLLEKAKKLGVVNISISPEFFASMKMAEDLRNTFSLTDAMVVPMYDTTSKTSEEISHQLGIGAAQILKQYMKHGQTLGIGWGQTVGAFLRVLPEETFANNTIIGLTGGVNAYMEIVLGMKSRAKLNAGIFIPTPIFVSDHSLANYLRKEQSVKSIVENAKACEIAVIGIGAVSEQSTLTQTGLATKEDIKSLQQDGACGDVIGLFYDQNGEIIDIPLHKRRIGIELETLKNIPTVIGIAGGASKVDAIQAALKGGIIDILVTDEDTASTILKQTETTTML